MADSTDLALGPTCLTTKYEMISSSNIPQDTDQTLLFHKGDYIPTIQEKKEFRAADAPAHFIEQDLLPLRAVPTWGHSLDCLFIIAASPQGAKDPAYWENSTN